MPNKFYLTTSIAYVNAAPHVGYAFELVQADAVARYNRLLNKDVYFLSGTDEHGVKIQRTAEAAGKDVKDFTDENAEKFKRLISDLNISADDFIRTTDRQRHWPGAQMLWQKMTEAGDIYKADYDGLYCIGCEAFVTEKDLIDGKCPLHNREPEHIFEENYFFRLSKYKDAVKAKLEKDEIKIIPESRKNEILKMLDSDIQDLSISRPIEKNSWGVPVPGDAKQVMYVWVDALSNYISALGYGLPRAESRGDDGENFKKYWTADTRKAHFIGKDISRFHALVWPAMLMSAGLELPNEIFVHGYLLSDGKKMSKSLGNTIDPFMLIEKYGADAVRYFLLREITPSEDGDITDEKIKEAYNGNLANGLGNLVSRVMKMSESNLELAVPSALGTASSKLPVLGDSVSKYMEGFEFNKAMDEIWKKIAELDLQIQTTQPFKLIKIDSEAAKTIIRELVAGLSEIAEALQPFLPETARKISDAILANKMPEPLFGRK